MDLKQKIAIIATSHHSFAGGGKNKTRVLHELAKIGYDVEYVGFKKPHYFEYTKTDVKLNICNPVISHAFEYDSILLEASLVEKIMELTLLKIDYGKHVIVWGSNLFPFANAAYSAKNNIWNLYNKKVTLITSPVGSDIWQIGPFYRQSVKRLLFSNFVDYVITYTKKFEDEINQIYGNGRKFEIIPPILDTETFFTINENLKNKLKNDLGFPSGSLIVINHSNMRPIKNIEEVIEIVFESSKMTPKKIVLLLVGPIQNLKEFSFSSWDYNKIDNNVEFFTNNNLIVCLTGLVSNVDLFLKISDICINSSLHDSFNISIMEAMACGLPCISSDVVGIGDSIVSSNGGFLYKMNGFELLDLNDIITQKKGKVNSDIEYAISKLIFLIENDEYRKTMGIAASNHVRNMYNKQFIINKYEDLFNKINIDNDV